MYTATKEPSKLSELNTTRLQEGLKEFGLNVADGAFQQLETDLPTKAVQPDKPDMSVPDFVQPTSTIKPVGVREATVSELAARDEAGYRGTSTNPFELPVVGNEEKGICNCLRK